MGPDVFNRVFVGLRAFLQFFPTSVVTALVIDLEVIEGIVRCVFLDIDGDAVAFAHHVVAEGNFYPVTHVFYIDVVVADGIGYVRLRYSNGVGYRADVFVILIGSGDGCRSDR